jgi:hypothetical protein
MTSAEFRIRFPHASESTIRANCDDYISPKALREAPTPVVERDLRLRALGTDEPKKSDTGRFLVRVTSFRRRLLDEDNLCEKYVVDCCRYAGLLPGDAPGTTRIEVRQEKVRSKEEERTEIVIERAP